ncbi:hypothetical protein REPUB_Repub04eG0043900 [Reevesia pubescens]
MEQGERIRVDNRRVDDSDPNSTVFVENLPDNVSLLKLKNLFKTFGDIKDVFVTKKKNKSQKVFRERTMLWNHQEEVRTSASSEDKKIRLLENFKRPGVTFKEALMMDKDRKLKKKEVSVHSLDEGNCLGFLNQTCIA